MKFHDLSISALGRRRRLGRGIGSGHGKTAGRGTKGQNARSGGKRRPGFEGGQNPLLKRLPKTRGFRPVKGNRQAVVHTDQLNCFTANAVVNKTELVKAGLIDGERQAVKLLQRGPVERPLTLRVDSASSAARTAVESAGGKLQRDTEG